MKLGGKPKTSEFMDALAAEGEQVRDSSKAASSSAASAAPAAAATPAAPEQGCVGLLPALTQLIVYVCLELERCVIAYMRPSSDSRYSLTTASLCALW
jgi:hypothetical protein